MSNEPERLGGLGKVAAVTLFAGIAAIGAGVALQETGDFSRHGTSEPIDQADPHRTLEAGLLAGGLVSMFGGQQLLGWDHRRHKASQDKEQ